jgi:competence protein ComEC
VSGLLYLLSDENSHIKVGRIVISADPSQKTSENYESLLKFAKLRDIPVCPMRAGDSMRWSRVSIECLWPGSKDKPLQAPVDLNDGSLVLSLEYDKGSGCSKLRALFTGDISTGVEDTLVPVLREKSAGISGTDPKEDVYGYDLLQVAHHGSASAANENFIKAVSPGAALISAGIDNRYGHPHRETLDILKQNGIPVLVTSECGETDIKEGRGRIFSVFTHLSLQ